MTWIILSTVSLWVAYDAFGRKNRWLLWVLGLFCLEYSCFRHILQNVI